MTRITAMKQALDALEATWPKRSSYISAEAQKEAWTKHEAAIEALRSAVAQPESEPTIKESLKVHASAEDYLRHKYGAYRGHFAWRELEDAYSQGRYDESMAQGPSPWPDDPVEKIAFSGAGESPPIFARRWKLAVDGFGLQRDDSDGNYIHIDDALSVLHHSLAAPQVADYVPLSDRDIDDIYQAETGFCINEGHGSDIALLDFAKAIERAARGDTP